jgi:hypothetical protein
MSDGLAWQPHSRAMLHITVPPNDDATERHRNVGEIICIDSERHTHVQMLFLHPLASGLERCQCLSVVLS